MTAMGGGCDRGWRDGATVKKDSQTDNSVVIVGGGDYKGDKLYWKKYNKEGREKGRKEGRKEGSC